MKTRTRIVLAVVVLSALVGFGGCARARRPDSTKPERIGGADVNRLWSAVKDDPIPGQLTFLEMEFEPFVFSGAELPKPQFKEPEKVRALLGDYEISATYYNAGFEPVEEASRPGRYGGVAHIRFASGVSMDRCYTLFRTPGELSGLDWWRWASMSKDPVTLTLPPELGIDPAAKGSSEALSRFVRFGFYEDTIQRPYAARLLAGLLKSSSGQAATELAGDPIVRDRQWWVQLKQRLHPVEGLRAKARGPVRLGEPAGKTLVLESAGGAGMARTVRELDRVLREWEKDTEEAFAVAVVRQGKVVFHRAYGRRDGTAMTVDTPSHMASIHKMLTALLVMMMADQGVLSLDDDVTRFLPGLRGVPMRAPLKVRHLLDHTSGLPDLTLDELHDLEEVIKPFLPHIQPGARFAYTETGYSLCGKILEAVTGKTVPEVFEEYLIRPLELEHTRIRGAASDAWSTPLDMAKIGQLLLNRGTYGNLRYVREETFAQMLPSATSWGLGLHETAALTAFSKPVMSAGVRINPELGFGTLIGHGADSGATFAVDLDHDLVVVMTRNRLGAKDQSHYQEFIKTLASGLLR